VEELIQQYASQLRNERNVSAHTLRNYLSDLAQFCQFLIEKGLCLGEDGSVAVSKVDVYVMRAYLAALTKSRKKSSVGRKIAALRGFFRYLVATHHIEKDPLLLIHSPKQ
jgi:integrase/recombinase XerC